MVATCLVAEPERDDGDVDAGVRAGASRRCAAGCGGEIVLPARDGQWRAADGGVGGQTLFDGVAAERVAAAGREQRVGGIAVAFGEPGAQDCR